MSVHVLVAGGCQVKGYPVGESNGFVHLFINQVFHGNAELTVVPHVPLSHVEMVENACVTKRPDLLILQIGNWESTPRLGDRLRRWAGRESRKPNVVSLPPETVYHPNAFQRIRRTVKGAADATFGHCFINLARRRAQLCGFYDRIERIGIPHVIEVGPLPCSDPMTMYYRRKFADLVAAEADRRSFIAVNAMNALRESVGGRMWSEIFSDAIHLNGVGHRVLGSIVLDVSSRKLGALTADTQSRRRAE